MGEIFNVLVDALGSVLSFFFDLLHDYMDDGVAYGLSIILLTITINILVFPLTLKQTRATRAFTALQPEIKRIQAEYKDDPQEMQRRLMAAQKEAGATPGGCLLPLLVQMPIWFALFRLLSEPLDHIAADSALGQSISSGTANSFLGMMLNTSPSEAVSTEGFWGALPYVLMIIFMVATQYVQQWHSTYGQTRPSGSAGCRGATGHHQDHAVVHRFHLVELPRRSGPLLGHLQPLPSRSASVDIQDRWSPTLAWVRVQRVAETETRFRQ